MASIERLTLNDVDFEIEKRACDTVLVGFGDMQGRLAGVRLSAQQYLTEGLPNGVRIPAYLLTTDAAGVVRPGFEIDSAATGFRDLVLRIDQTAFFRMPWQEATVGALGDLEFSDGTSVTMAPRALLKRHVQRLEGQGYTAALGIEQQFSILADGSLPGGHLVSRSARFEPTIRRVRRAIGDLPLPLEGSHGMQAPGVFELTLRSGDPVQVCDGTLLLRDIVKEFATQDGLTATFMAAPAPDMVAASHVSVSLRGVRASSALADHYGEGGLSEIGKAFVAGVLQHAPELCVLLAPNVNSYRRFGADPFTPSNLTWGLENRTCAVRVTGRDASLRVENRLAGADANPYLAAAATIAAGLDGITHQLRLPPATEGDARASDAPALPASLAEAADLWSSSAWVGATFGIEVQQHYGALAALEVAAQQDASDAASDLAWELERYVDGC